MALDDALGGLLSGFVLHNLVVLVVSHNPDMSHIGLLVVVGTGSQSVVPLFSSVEVVPVNLDCGIDVVLEDDHGWPVAAWAHFRKVSTRDSASLLRRTALYSRILLTVLTDGHVVRTGETLSCQSHAARLSLSLWL